MHSEPVRQSLAPRFSPHWSPAHCPLRTKWAEINTSVVRSGGFSDASSRKISRCQSHPVVSISPLSATGDSLVESARAHGYCPPATSLTLGSPHDGSDRSLLPMGTRGGHCSPAALYESICPFSPAHHRAQERARTPSLGAALGVTSPFKVTLGIPLSLS